MAQTCLPTAQVRPEPLAFQQLEPRNQPVPVPSSAPSEAIPSARGLDRLILSFLEAALRDDEPEDEDEADPVAEKRNDSRTDGTGSLERPRRHREYFR